MARTLAADPDALFATLDGGPDLIARVRPPGALTPGDAVGVPIALGNVHLL